MEVTKDQYWSIVSSFDNIPTEQSKCWIDAIYSQSAARLVYFVNSVENPNVACVGYSSYHRFLGRHLHIEGLCLNNKVPVSEIKSFFTALTEEDYSYISFSDIYEYRPDFEVAIRRAGFIRPAGISLCPLTMMIDLQSNFTFHKTWVRGVKKSIASGNTFEFIKEPNHDYAVIFEGLFKSMSERKGLKSYPKAYQVEKLLSQNSPYHLFVIKNKCGNIISARVEYTNQNLVYDIWAANSDEAMKTGAAYHIQEEVFNFYKNLNYSKFDYGRIPPSADYMDNIYLAKSYSGGYPVAYNGQWEYSKSNLYSFLLSFRAFILNKQRRY